MAITLRQLAIFVSIVQHHSTIQAAQVLCLSQSAVSSALAELEHQLARPLFDRVSKRLVMNAYGRKLYGKAQLLLQQAQEIEQLFDDQVVRWRLAASSTIGNYLLPTLFADIALEELELTIGNSAEVINQVADSRVDVGLIEGHCQHPDIISQAWQQDQLVVFAAPSHPLAQLTGVIAIEQLAKAAWILREPGSGTAEIVQHLLLNQLVDYRVALTLSSSEAVKHWVSQGLGISCLSRHALMTSLTAGSLVEINTPLTPLSRTLSVIYHRQRQLPARLLALLQG